jgi:peptide/nickel transport system substrate-binding protein
VLGTKFLVLDSSRPPFDDVRARRALNFAVDRTKMIELGEGPSLAELTCQLMPPRMPSYRRYCPYTTGPPDGSYRGPDVGRASALVRASGTVGTEVDVGAVFGDRVAPYLARVLRALGYRATVRRFPDNFAGYIKMSDPSSGLEVAPGDWAADYPAPSTMYEITACPPPDTTPLLPGHCDPEMDRRAAAAASMLQSEPGQALRAWTEIDRDVTDLAPFVAYSNNIRVWLSSERVGNYLTGDITPGPLLSQIWVN